MANRPLFERPLCSDEYWDSLDFANVLDQPPHHFRHEIFQFIMACALPCGYLKAGRTNEAYDSMKRIARGDYENWECICRVNLVRLSTLARNICEARDEIVSADAPPYQTGPLFVHLRRENRLMGKLSLALDPFIQEAGAILNEHVNRGHPTYRPGVMPSVIDDEYGCLELDEETEERMRRIEQVEESPTPSPLPIEIPGVFVEKRASAGMPRARPVSDVASCTPNERTGKQTIITIDDD